MLVNISMRVGNLISLALIDDYMEVTEYLHRHDAYGDDAPDPEIVAKVKDIESWFRSHGLAINADGERSIDPEADWLFVSKYTVHRVYGGPEEGGWWFDHYTFDGVQDILHEDDAHDRCRQLNKSTGKESRFDVNGGPDVRYVAEQFPKKRHTWHRPIWS